MADFVFDGRVKVKTLKDEFKKNFGATLRVYTNIACEGEQAADDATLASIRAEGYSGGEFSVKGNMKVSSFEKKVAELYGIGVQVANADDTEFADDAATLMGAATTASAESGHGHTIEKPAAAEAAPKVEASAAELASARVKVYGKAQNRTALGIIHAYMVMYPHANLDDLRKAFPDALNPQAPEEGLLMYATKPVPKGEYRSYFDQPEELLTTGDGKKVQFVCMWTKPAFENLAIHAKQYGIIIADFEKADGGAKKGGFRLEYLNGYVPPVVKKSKAGLWIAIAVVAVLLALLAVLLGRKPEPQIVEVEKIVTVVDTVYVKQIEEIEKSWSVQNMDNR